MQGTSRVDRLIFPPGRRSPAARRFVLVLVTLVVATLALAARAEAYVTGRSSRRPESSPPSAGSTAPTSTGPEISLD